MNGNAERIEKTVIHTDEFRLRVVDENPRCPHNKRTIIQTMFVIVRDRRIADLKTCPKGSKMDERETICRRQLRPDWRGDVVHPNTNSDGSSALNDAETLQQTFPA